MSRRPGTDKKSDDVHCIYFCLMFRAMHVHVPREGRFAPRSFSAGPLIRILKINKSEIRFAGTAL